MSEYIETRPEAITAIHKCIIDKWNPICMGCVDSEPDCCLCREYKSNLTYSYGGCEQCPLGMAGMTCNIDGGNPYGLWDESHDCHNCNQKDKTPCDLKCPGAISRPQEAEAMLEALVQLLPESERIIYGG